MRAFLAVLLWGALLLQGTQLWAWGRTGHRVVGKLAERLVTPQTRQHIKALLGNESLAQASLWADAMKSYPAKDFLRPWHYVVVPEGDHIPPITDDTTNVLEAIEHMVEILQGTREHPDVTATEALRLLVHFVGDVHQPLHVSRPWDRGGTRFKVDFFGRVGNLHWVWDSAIVDWYQLSYTEWVDELLDLYEGEDHDWQSDDVMQWAQESLDWHGVVYDFSHTLQVLNLGLGDLRSRTAHSVEDMLKLYPDALMNLLEHTDDDIAYRGPSPAGARIPKARYHYIRRSLPVVKDNLYRAGQRLAYILDSIW